MNREEFAKLIRALQEYRARYQHSYSELANLLGVPLVTLRKWIDSHHAARPQTVERIKECEPDDEYRCGTIQSAHFGHQS
jgi:DNA-binding transcriptional regulator YiaG